MKANKRTPTWPVFGMLACLFVLTVTAPRAWQRLASREALVSTTRVNEPTSSVKVALRAQREIVDRDSAPVDERAGGSLPEDASAVATADPVVTALPSADELISILSGLGGDSASMPTRREEPLFAMTPPMFESQYAGDVVDDRTTDSVALSPVPRDPFGRLRDEFPDTFSTKIESARTSKSPWPLPVALHSQLESLRERGIATEWSDAVLDQLTALVQAAEFDCEASRDALAALTRLVDEAENLVAATEDAAHRASLERVAFALERRLALWRSTIAAATLPAEDPIATTSSPRLERLVASLDKIESLTRGQKEGDSWRAFIRYDELRDITATSTIESAAAARSLSQLVIARLDRASRSSKYRSLLTEGPFEELSSALAPLAAETVDLRELLNDVERYETTRLSSDAKSISQKMRWLSSSEASESRELGRQLAERYLLPNVRIAVTEPMINRIAKQRNVQREAVHDNILGADVHGYSVSLTNVHVKLIPDANHVRLGLEADGAVSSNTNARSGPAQLRSEGRSRFKARKVFVFGTRGLESLPSEAEATGYQDNLLSVSTDFDGLPLFGPLARRVAQTQHEDSRDSVRRIIERKVASRAKNQLDREVQSRMTQLQSTLEHRIVESLDRLAIHPEPIDFTTTPERVTMQWRLASHDQLAAHTPRPWAPKDSQLSLQIHQTAINNALDRLDLNGRTLSAPEIYRWVAEKLGKADPSLPEDLPEDAQITFAASDALRVRCDEDRVELTISLAELSQGKRHWRNFSAQAYFRPEVDGLQVRLVRDTAIYLGGETLRGKPQVVLRGIFSKLMPRDRVWELLPSQWQSDPRLRGLELTQFTVVDGWVGLAVGPPRDPVTAGRDTRVRKR